MSVRGMFDEYLGIPNTQQTNPDTVSGYTFDPNSIDIASLQNLDLSNLNLDQINVPTYNELNAALTGTSTAPSTLDELINLYNQQSGLLSSVGTLENVDINDRPYWYNSGVSGALANPLGVSGEEFRAAAGLPDSFSIYDSGQGLTQDNAEAALTLLNNSEDPMQALSQYYGIDFQRAENPDANYTNAGKYGTDEARLAEFQSIVEPVLQKVIPYLQLTQGLRYDEALEYAYKNDPMIAALYNQYDVDLFRQTSDGSTYFFDPISGTESRTIEVKNSDFRDVGLALTIAAASAILGPQIGQALGGTPLANATGKALASGFRTVASGGDFSDVLQSMATAGVLDYGLSQLAENVDLQNALNDFGENFGIGTEISLSGEYSTLADGTIVLTETMGTQGNLGDILGGLADAIQNPSSWTPSSLEEANVIWNLAGEAVTTGSAMVGEGGLTVGTFYELLKNTKEVYDNANQPPPPLENGYTITWDLNTNDPVIIDKDGNTVGGLPQPTEDTDNAGGGGGGGSEADTTTTTTDTTTTTPKPDASYDNVIASQIWEAYQSETDPNLKEKLLQEYIDYTGSDQPPVDNGKPEDLDERGTVTKYYVDLDGNVQPYYEGMDIKATLYDTFEDAQDAANKKKEEEVTLDNLLGTGIFDSTVDGDTTITTTSQPTTELPTTTTTGGVGQVEPSVTDGGGWLPTDGDTTGGTAEGGSDTTGGTGGGTDTGEGAGDGSGTGGGSGTGEGGGDGAGEGTGEGEGSGSGSGGGFGSGSGMFGLGGGGGSQPITPQSFMASISYAPELLTPYMPRQSKDYLAELIARLQK